MDTLGKFGEHEGSVRVVRGEAESNSSFFFKLSACIHISIYSGTPFVRPPSGRENVVVITDAVVELYEVVKLSK